MALSQPTAWSADTLLPDFAAATLPFPADYDGPVYATLVRRKTASVTTKAFLYIHGYMDYFFQTHLAAACNAQGYTFYALDLRKYGRSLGPTQHPNFCKDLHEYFAEISVALRIITEEEGHDWVVLSGHSTGGLTAALYANEGPEKARIDALFLNSPFFDFNLDPKQRRQIEIAARLGAIFPFMALQRKEPVPYIESIHADHHGEWPFDLRFRPLNSFPIYAGWLRAVQRAQRQLRRGLAIHCPVLVMHADKSVYGRRWRPDFQAGDGVLNVVHIREGSRHLGTNVKVVEIEDGLHDLILSRPEVRAAVFTQLFEWLANVEQSSDRRPEWQLSTLMS
ncbi:MAG: alpha/beta hydrolase [Caldilineaceae bacterium]